LQYEIAVWATRNGQGRIFAVQVGSNCFRKEHGSSRLDGMGTARKQA